MMMRPYQGSERSRPRGEQFRHSLNIQRSRITRTRDSATLRGNPSIPEYDAEDPGSLKAESWLQISKVDTRTTSTWRAHALDLILRHSGSEGQAVPPLTQLCLRILTSFPSSEFTEDVVPFLPSHLRRDLIRHAAIHAPLPSSKIYSMYAHEGHADGELLIVGPQAILRDDFFIRDNNGSERNTSQDSSDWDSEKPVPPSLRTFILMSTSMANPVVLSLPPTITHMALLNLTAPIALHRLPGLCPLLEVLDLSYNTWLSFTSRDAPKILERVEWGRWNCLRVLGLRECFVSDAMLQKLNKGRWDDVQIVVAESMSAEGSSDTQ